VLVDVSAGLSIKGYQAADAKVRWIQAWNDRLEFWTDARYEHFPQEDFYGMGLESARENETSYGFDSTDIMLRGVVKPIEWFSLGTTVGYLRADIGSGSDSNVPSIERLFVDSDAPGLASDTNYLHTTLFAEVDRRDIPGNPTRGGVYRTSFGYWDDRRLQAFDHRRFDALAVHHVPLAASGTHVLTGRLGTSYVNNETGERVPFYYLAYVGGVDTIRSFDEFRFKDENALWMTAEYRFRFHKYASVVTFVDAGKVERDWQDLTFTGLKKGYGFGFRAHTRTQTLARIDFGFGGGEGWRAFLKLGPSF
jgi:outer membrane protein assembly factor BamA